MCGQGINVHLLQGADMVTQHHTPVRGRCSLVSALGAVDAASGPNFGIWDGAARGFLSRITKGPMQR